MGIFSGQGSALSHALVWRGLCFCKQCCEDAPGFWNHVAKVFELQSLLLNYFFKESCEFSLPAVRPGCPCHSAPLPASAILTVCSLGRHRGQRCCLFRLSGCVGHGVPTSGGLLSTSTPSLVLACSQGHLIPISCDTRDGPAAAGAVAARKEGRWQGHQSVVVWMENPGLGPGQSRKGRRMLGLARWQSCGHLGRQSLRLPAHSCPSEQARD